MNNEQSFEQEVLRSFSAFAYRNMSFESFRRWVFATPDIADVVGYDQYFLLLDIDYGLASGEKDALQHVTELAEQHWPGQLLREYIRTILCGLLNGSIHVISAFEQLSWWRENGAPWIPIIFVGLDSELDAAPDPKYYFQWQPDALTEKLAEVEPWVTAYSDTARTEAQTLLLTEFGENACA